MFKELEFCSFLFNFYQKSGSGHDDEDICCYITTGFARHLIDGWESCKAANL